MADNNTAVPAFYLWAAEAPYLCALYMSQVLFLFMFYAVLVVVVARTEQLRTPGYAMLVSLLTAETANNLLMHLGGTLPITLHYQGIINYTFTAGFHLASLQQVAYFMANLHMVVISAQRYCAVAYYRTYKRIFTFRTIVIIIAIILPLSILFSLPCYVGPCIYFFSPDYFGPIVNFDNPWTITYFYFLNIFYNGGTLSIIIIFGIMFFYKLRKIKKNTAAAVTTSQLQDAQALNQSIKEETRLSIQIFVIVVYWVLGTVEWFLVNTFVSRMPLSISTFKAVFSIQNVFMIWMFGLDSLVILAMNKRLRTRALELVCRKSPANVSGHTASTQPHTSSTKPLVVAHQSFSVAHGNSAH